MHVAKLAELGFKRQDEHTVGYAKRCVEFIGGKEGEGLNSDLVFTEHTKGFMLACAPTAEQCLEKLRLQVAEYLLSVSWVQADTADFYFRTCISEVDENGLFWEPNGKGGRKFRVSDLEIL